MLLLTNARVWTGNARRPWAEALATRESRIAAVGSSAEIMKLARGGGRVIDLHGAMVVPGFVDAHIHLIPSALRLESVQLRDVRSRDELRRALSDFARTLPAGRWITGGDWDHQRWGGELPSRDWIDDVTAEHPVFISRHDGHMALANSLALGMADVHASSRDPVGGVIVRGGDGTPTGVLKDEAMRLVQDRIPAPATSDAVRAVRRACAYLAERGVTSVHHMGTWDDVSLLRSARATGDLRTRTYAAVPMGEWQRLAEEIRDHGAGDDWIRIGGLKAFMDGSLGSHTAAFIEPYADAPDDRGLFVADPDDLRQQLRGARAHGLHPIIHAIGDRAVRTVLDLYEREWGGVTRDRPRPRIEHAQHVHPEDLPRFTRLDVIASMQPYHLADDGRWAARVIGAAREAQAFPIGSLVRSGASVAFGSDWFVAPPDPLQAIQAAVTRRTLDGRHPGGWTPAERVSVTDALHAHTLAGALAEGTDAKGALARGKLADLAVIDRDLTTAPPEQIGSARILLTVIDGEIVYDALGS